MFRAWKEAIKAFFRQWGVALMLSETLSLKDFKYPQHQAWLQTGCCCCVTVRTRAFCWSWKARNVRGPMRELCSHVWWQQSPIESTALGWIFFFSFQTQPHTPVGVWAGAHGLARCQRWWQRCGVMGTVGGRTRCKILLPLGPASWAYVCP